jgi:hypothetical protein
MDANKRRLLGRPKRGKANQVTRTEAFLKRQREFCRAPSSCMLNSWNTIQGDKSWLETHIWHAKRARMQNMWGYRLVCLVRPLNVCQLMNSPSGRDPYGKGFPTVLSRIDAWFYLTRRLLLCDDRAQRTTTAPPSSARTML